MPRRTVVVGLELTTIHLLLNALKLNIYSTKYAEIVHQVITQIVHKRIVYEVLLAQ